MKGQRTHGRFGIKTNKTIKYKPNDFDSSLEAFLSKPKDVEVLKSERQRSHCIKCIEDKREKRIAFKEQQEIEQANCVKEKKKFKPQAF